jgi:hypothetical protein
MNVYCHVPASSSTIITGSELAYRCRGRNARELAFLAADIHAGTLVVERPTLKQAVLLVGSNTVYARFASRTQPVDRWKIEAGILPMAPPDKIIERAIRTIGVDHTFDILCAALA